MNRYIMVDGPFKKVAFLSEHTIEELQDKSIVNSGEYRYVTLLTKHGLGVQCPSNICFDRQIKVYADDHRETFVGFKYPDWHNQIIIE